jgi:coronin-7
MQFENPILNEKGLALMPKHVCQVKDVEFARFSTLTSNSIEPLSFTVPRVKVNSPSNLSENVK